MMLLSTAKMSTIKSVNCTYTVKDANITSSTANDGIMWFLLFAMPMVAIFGIIGNIFSFVILKESALKNVSHLYLVFLAIFDSMTLISVLYSFYGKVILYPMLVRMGLYSPALHYFNNSFTLCHFRMYTTFVLRLISVWTIVLFSIDRFMAMVIPMKSQSISTIKNTIIALSTLVVVSFLISIPWFFAYGKQYDKCMDVMQCKGNNLSQKLLLVQFVFLTVVPSIIICSCNITIVFILRNRQRHSTLVSKKEAMSQERMITIRLLLVSSAFVVLTLPSLVIISINTEYKSRNDHSYKQGHLANALHIGLFLFTVNLAINFILYCLTGPNFRRAAWSILRCKYNEMRFYRKVILNPNVATDTNATDLTDPTGRSNSVSSEKNHCVGTDQTKKSIVALPLRSALVPQKTSSDVSSTKKPLLDTTI